ncbi:MAG: autotransporter-associated beta strand repeat-containing protein [Acidobacteriota bacterium]
MIVYTNASSPRDDPGGQTRFLDDANAGSATFINNGAQSAGFFGSGLTAFFAGSAADGLFINNGGEVSGAQGGSVYMSGSPTAGSGVFVNQGATVSGALGGLTQILGGSDAGNATLIANGGVNGGLGGVILLTDSATGGTARAEIFGNGQLDVSAHNTFTGGATIGSIEGDGTVFLGSINLTTGANNLSTVFSGVLRDGGIVSGSGGSLSKIGEGNLTLSGANLYTGATKLSGGELIISNTVGSATGSGSVQITAGLLGGSGTITGSVTVGTGHGPGAFLAPAAGTRKQATLTIQSGLTFNSDATYIYTFKAKRNKFKMDNVIANGVTINSGASLNLSGQAQGTLTQGTVLPVISNTSTTSIAGTFSNLPDGAIVTVNGNNLQASYSGGDGNDLTLTVVP